MSEAFAEETIEDAARLERLRKLFAGVFEIEVFLGRGGYAEVYRVRNVKLGRTEALKILMARPSEDPSWAERFTQEARLAASLEHPNIVQVHDSGQAGGLLWYSMRFVEGQTLATEMQRRGKMNEAEASRLALPLLSALEYSHQRGIVHRDVKPANILLDPGGTPHLMDFGIAKGPQSAFKTQTGIVLGTPAFVSPEQAQGQTTDGRSDLYSLGAMLHQMVSGRPPFEAADPLQSVLLRLTNDPPALRTQVPDVDETFETIVLAALARDRKDRFSNATAMREALEAYLRGDREGAARSTPGPESFVTRSTRIPAPLVPPSQLAEAREATATSRLPVRGKRNRALVAVAAVAAVAAVGTLGIAIRFWQGANERPRSIEGVPAQAARPLAPTPIPSPPAIPEPTAAPPPGSSPVRVPRPQGAEPAPPPVVRRPVVSPLRIVAEGDDVAPEGTPPSCNGSKAAVSVTVGETGEVVRSTVLSGLPECGPFALQAVRRWRFQPGHDAQGVPVESRLAVEFTFAR